MKFPKGKPLLESTPLEFINLDNVLSASKRERAHRISGYISIVYPNSVELIFLKEGEPFNAARISQSERKIVPINEVVEKAKKATSGVLSQYATDETLVNLMISSIVLKPRKENVDLTKLQPRIFVDKLKTTKFSGFIWVKAGVDESFIHLEQGDIRGVYIAGTAKKLQSGEVGNFLMRPKIKVSIFDHVEEATIMQATPAQVSMYCKIFSSLLKKYAHPIGETVVLKTFELAKSTVEKEFPFMEQLKIGADLTISGNVVVEPKQCAQGMARWFDIIYESFSTILGKESEVIAKKVLNDYRFALKSLHFFEYSKLKI